MADQVGKAGIIGRGMRRIAVTRWGTWIILNVLTYLDIPLLRLTNGRLSLSGLTGYPIGLLITIGAKSGQERIVPLLIIREGDNLFLVASRGGKPRHPAWYHNLKANPRTHVLLPGATGTYFAREAEGEERDRLWHKALALYRGFGIYQTRATERVIPVMVLEPVGL